MSGIELCPVKGGNPVEIPKEKKTIGRGPFLEVTDKRVSRNHATLEVINGKLVLTPIHTNPCFFLKGGVNPQSTLEKDKPKVLQHADVVGLLPDKYFFKVTYKDQAQEKTSSRTPEKKKEEAVANGGEENSEDEDEEEEDVKPVPTGIVKRGHKEMALPIQKQRKLPSWMKGAGKRVTLETSAKKPAKPSPKARPVATNAKPPQKRQRKAAKYSEDDDDDDNDDDEDYEEVKPKRSRPPPRRRQRRSESSEEDEDSDKKPIRRPRAASLKKPKYRDDFVVSGDNLGLSSQSDEDQKQGNKEEDSDFSLGNNDDSDWEKPSRKSKSKSNTPRSRGKTKKRPARRSRYSEDDDDDDDDSDGMSESDEETYIPRPSKRRGGGGAKRRRKDSDSDDWEEMEQRNKPKRRPSKKRKVSSTSSSSEEEDEQEARNKRRKKVKKGSRSNCRYAENCYRKNPQHFEEFSHPGDSSWDSDDADDKPSQKTKGRPQRKVAARPKDKKSVLHGASDDDGNANTYDYDDSFIDNKGILSDSEEESSEGNESDSDWEPDMGSDEDVRGLVREARGFVRNKKMARPLRYK